MSDPSDADRPDADRPETAAEFNDALDRLLRRAAAADVDVAGGWECRNSDDYPDWDVVVTELSKK